jgi:hypothetical protein
MYAHIVALCPFVGVLQVTRRMVLSVSPRVGRHCGGNQPFPSQTRKVKGTDSYDCL